MEGMKELQPHPIIWKVGFGKSTLVNALATKLSAELIRRDPVVSKSDLRIRMDETGPCTRREYYRCGNFHASLLIEEYSEKQACGVDRWPRRPVLQSLKRPIRDGSRSDMAKRAC